MRGFEKKLCFMYGKRDGPCSHHMTLQSYLMDGWHYQNALFRVDDDNDNYFFCHFFNVPFCSLFN